MKKTSILAIAIIALVAMSCKKEDNYQPVISINGDYEKVVSLNSSYTEEGATATDNEDGDITDKVIVTGSVDVNEKGEYRIYYDVTDAAGNKAQTAVRYVQVVNDADYMMGTYLASPACSGSSTYNTAVTPSSSENNVVWINRVYNSVQDDPVRADISGSTITIPQQTIGWDVISGTGTISGNSFSLVVTFNGFPFNCTIDHTKL